jgi:hypothetical protein
MWFARFSYEKKAPAAKNVPAKTPSVKKFLGGFAENKKT